MRALAGRVLVVAFVAAVGMFAGWSAWRSVTHPRKDPIGFGPGWTCLNQRSGGGLCLRTDRPPATVRGHP